MKRNEYLYKKLQMLVDYGVLLFLNGEPSTPDKVARTVNSKKEHYEPGFVYSLDGNLSELNYIRIA